MTASMSCGSSQPPRDFSSFPDAVLLPHPFPASFDVLVIRSSLIAQLGFICSFDTLESRLTSLNGSRSIHSHALYGQVFSAELAIIMYPVTFSIDNNHAASEISSYIALAIFSSVFWLNRPSLASPVR